MNKDILELLMVSIRDCNRQLSIKQKIAESVTAHLFGEKGPLDSLGLVNFIVIVEERIYERFGSVVSLADERAMSRTTSPFRTVETLASYIEGILVGDENGN